MKIQLKFFAILILASGLAFTACDGGTSLSSSTIVFTDGSDVSIALNGGPYTNIVTGDGSGEITYSSGTPETATVDENTGKLTLVSVGTTVITAVKAATATHKTVTGTYTLTVTEGITYAVGGTGPSGIGLVFYITDGGLHGLEVAPVDQSPSAAWSTIVNALANGNTELPVEIGTGFANTGTIIDQNDGESSAAQICRTYRASEEGDWFLPSKNELNELYINKDYVGVFANDYYWSSSEGNASNAWNQVFDNDGGQYSHLKSNSGSVRAVRAF